MDEYLKHLGDQDLINVALKAYFRKYNKAGVNLIHPGKSSSYADSRYVYLGNGSDLLARYDFIRRRFTELTTEVIQEYEESQRIA